MMCDVWLKARDAKSLTKIQLPVADRADIVRSSARNSSVSAMAFFYTTFHLSERSGSLRSP